MSFETQNIISVGHKIKTLIISGTNMPSKTFHFFPKKNFYTLIFMPAVNSPWSQKSKKVNILSVIKNSRFLV